MNRNKQQRIARIIAILVAISMLLGVAGFLLSTFGAEYTGRISFEVYGQTLRDNSEEFRSLLSEDPQKLRNFIDFFQLIRYIESNYKDEVSVDSLFEGAYEGMFDSLKDEYSEYLIDGSIAENYEKIIDTKYVGIGIIFRQENQRYVINFVMPDSPAEEAGIQDGDIIVAVDGVNVLPLDRTDVVSRIRGEEGTVVKMSLQRRGENLDFSVTRKHIIASTATGNMLDEKDIGYIKISSFGESTVKDFDALMERLGGEGMKSLILDLRGNTGGYLSGAVTIAERFLDDVPIVFFRQQGELKELRADPGKEIYMKTVVLVDGVTASASEVLAGALKDNGVATIVGTTTYGKGIIQRTGEHLGDNSYKISTHYFLTPSKQEVNGKGIKPHYEIKSAGVLTPEEIAELRIDLAPIDAKEKYGAGQAGLSVYGAQQRLRLLGYTASANGIMDSSTVLAVTEFQRDSKLYPYGVLDLTTQGKIAEVFEDYIRPIGEDEQLAKAVELLKAAN